MSFPDDEELRKEAETIVNMQQALESFSKLGKLDKNVIINSYKKNPNITFFLNTADSLHQLLWTINIFLRNRPKSSNNYLIILEDLIPNLQQKEITPLQLFNIFAHKRYNNFSAIDLLYQKGFITITDILNFSASNDSSYFHYKEVLDEKYQQIKNKSKNQELSNDEALFIQKYEPIVESHKFIHKKSSSEIQIQSNEIQKITNFIKNDDLDSFQEYLSNTNTNLQAKIKFQEFNKIDSIYLDKEISLIEYSAYQGSLQIFKFLWIQLDKSVKNSKLPLFSVVGGNYEIIHLVESEKNFVFDLECLITSIELHYYDITEYLMSIKELNFPFESEYSTSYVYLFRIIYSFNMKFILDNVDSFEFVINSLDDKTGLTPIQTAAYFGFTDMVKVLSTIDGVDLMQTCRSGENLLYISCLKGFVEIVQFLIDSGGVNINCKTDNGMTALHAVVQNESKANIEIIKILLSNGIDVNLFNRIFFFIIFFLMRKILLFTGL